MVDLNTSSHPQPQETPEHRLQPEVVLKEAIRLHASDIHISPGAHLAFSIHGRLVPMGQKALTQDQALHAIRGLMPPEESVKLQEREAADFRINFEGSNFRCNVVRTSIGLCATLRLVDGRIKTPQELGLPPAILDACNRDKGVFLVTGQTGSGKSTTLASLVDRIMSTRSVKVLTFEQPIEFLFQPKVFENPPGSKQLAMSLPEQQEVPNHIASFGEALRAGLRRAPNVIVVGELRDLDTMVTALQAAESGHLVLSTLHTNTAVDSVSRIVNACPEERKNEIRTLLSTNLIGVMSQVLVPRKDGAGRVLAYEYMVNTPAIANSIRNNTPNAITDAIVTGAKFGMTTMESTLFDLISQGVISPEQALLKAPRPAQLRSRLTGAH